MTATDDGNNPGPGSYNVSKVNIISSTGKQSKDMTKHPWRSINLVEGMGLESSEARFITGDIVILDAVGFYKEFALHGNEIIELEFSTPEKESISFMGRIYQISNPLPLGEKQAISLKFCSAEKYVADQFKWSVALKNMTYSDMAEVLFGPLHNLTKKKLYAEPTKGLHNVVIPNWSTVKPLNWIAGRSKSAKYLGSGYVFYERSDGVFVFSSLEALIDPNENKPVISYTYEKKDEGGSLKNFITVKDYDYLKTPNQVVNINRGMYSSTLLTNDLVKRQHKYYSYNYIKTYPHHKHVNENKIQSGQGTSMLINDEKLAQRPDSAVFLAPKHYQSFGDTSDNLVEETVLERNSQFQQMTNIKVRIVIPGDSQRRVGEIVYLNLPSIEPKTEANPTSIDPFYSGRYMISRIQHSLDAESNTYETIMELVKDSYTYPLPTKR